MMSLIFITGIKYSVHPTQFRKKNTTYQVPNPGSWIFNLISGTTDKYSIVDICYAKHRARITNDFFHTLWCDYTQKLKFTISWRWNKGVTTHHCQKIDLILIIGYYDFMHWKHLWKEKIRTKDIKFLSMRDTGFNSMKS